jgi:chemotaxis protein histidine kinase CheA
MGTETSEPMVEIFLKECAAVVSEMEEHVEEGRKKGAFERAQVDEIFRNIHTIKADAAMMLYENIAAPARTMEKVLYYYRDETDGVTDLEGFLKLMDQNLDFYRGEIAKMMRGGEPDGDSTQLTYDILSYVAKCKGEPVPEPVIVKPEEKKKEEPQITDGLTEQEQFFYIGSADEELPGSSGDPGDVFVPDVNMQKRPKHILVSVEEIDILDAINVRLFKYANTLSPEVQRILRELDNWLWRVHSTDFSMVAAKLTMTVKNMLGQLGKDVEFCVTGEEITVEKTKVEKISNALIHLVRNAVDHGIETPQERRQLGKFDKGHVNVTIEGMSDHSGICIRVSDDGRGLDMFELLDKAQEKNLLKKPYEEYTEAEAFELIFLPGFTTRERAGEFSGRGVGLDAVRSGLVEIGGTIRIESVYGVGTTFIMEIAYDMNVGKDRNEKRRALIDESINSRR